MNECFECGTRGELQQHHIIPRSQGGKHTIGLCLGCHSRVHGLKMSASELTKRGQEKKFFMNEFYAILAILVLTDEQEYIFSSVEDRSIEQKLALKILASKHLEKSFFGEGKLENQLAKIRKRINRLHKIETDDPPYFLEIVEKAVKHYG